MYSTWVSGNQSQNALLDVQKRDTAGRKLLALCTKIAPLFRDFTTFEDAMLDEVCVTCAAEDRAFLTKSVAQALRVLLKARRYKLVVVLLRKVKSMAAERILRDAAGILPFAVASCFVWETTWKVRRGCFNPDELNDIVQLLLDNGADLNSFDDHGNTAIFYACMLGNYDLFRKLLEEGAAISTTHTFTSWRQVTAFNLLQATLEAYEWEEIANPNDGGYPWKDVGNEWRRIASDLLDVGQRCSGSDPHMLKLLQTACFQGDSSLVQRLIEYGVPIDAPTVREHREGRFYACSLHAAAAGGQAHVVQLLLDRGAQSIYKGLSTCAQFDRRASRSPGRGPLRKTREQTALAVAIDATSHERETSLRRSKLWETCHVLMEAESLPEDHVELLELSARGGQASLVKRLLQMGYRLTHVPETGSFEIIRLLVQHDSKFEPCQAQKLAIERGDCRLLSDLFRTWGNLVPSEELRKSATEVISRNDIDMLDLLVSLYSVNEILFGTTDNDAKGETLIQIACRDGSMTTIYFLLEKGADLYLPETDNNALTALENRLKSLWKRPNNMCELWALAKLLEYHMPEKGERMREHYKMKSPPHKQIQIQRELDAGYSVSSPGPPSPEIKLLSPMERIDGGDFEHTPLSGHDAFRTMVLHPASDPRTVIECGFEQSSLCLPPEYEALSYVWGTNNVPRYIRLDGRVLQITPSLYDALLALRRDSEPRRLWVDAICINQRDVDERNRQVTLMGDIYMNAIRVVIWLGNSGKDSHLVFQHIARFRQHQEDVSSGRSRPPDDYGESHINMPRYKGATLEALHRLSQRPWFFRTWVIQEKVLSKEAMICCGPESATWEELFVAGCSFIGGLMDRPIHGLNYQNRTNELHELQPWTGYRRVLQYSRDCQVTDLKDRVYGILGLLRPGLIEVNYELDVQDIYCSFTRAVIEDSDSIDLLNLCGTKHTLPGLPSWVPDFNSRRSSCHLPNLHEFGRGIPLDWSDSHLTKVLPGLRFRNGGKDLVVRGKTVDTIRAVGDEMPVSKEYAPGTEKFSRILSGWERLAIENVSPQASGTCWASDDPRSTVSNAFLATMIATNGVFSNDSCSIGGVLWYKKYGTGALMRKERQYFEDVEYCTILSRDYMDDGTSYLTCNAECDRFDDKVEKTVYGRKLFVTAGGSLGLGEPTVQPGDEIVFLPGSMYPFAIRDFDGDAFTLLGDCYVHGFHALKLFDDHEKPITEYAFK